MRVYVYGAFPDEAATVLLDRQLLLGHRYRNELVAIERERRGRVDALLAQLEPRLAEVEGRVVEMDARLKIQLGHAGRANSRKRAVGVAAEQARAIRVLRAQLKK